MQPETNIFAGTPRTELIRLAAQQTWVHPISLGDGYTTPGLWGDANEVILEALDLIDFKGKKVLDIGCWDGRYSFLAEERGASEVYATDLVTQRWGAAPTFQLAAAARNSKAKYYPNCSVYDVAQLGVTDFDVVLYTGVYYHLKDPVRSITTLRNVLRTGGTILVEGAITPASGCWARFYYQEAYLEDKSNWWIPTPECLRQWVECSYFRITRDLGTQHEGHHAVNPRATLIAKAVSGKDPRYEYPAEGLEKFHV